MRALATIVRREVASLFYAPVAYVVGVAFLAVHGLSFWALMKALSDPTMPAEPGAVLRSFFGGTMLHWLVVFAVVSLLSMRSVAEDRRSGLWEAMLTTQVRLGTLLVAKWLALVIFYVMLWLPTLGLILILSRYIPEGASLDLGPVVAAYMAVIGVGAALLAVGVAFSTATENQIVAAVGCFTVLLAWLMFGELGIVGGPFNLREILDNAGRGELRLDGALVVFSVAVIAMASAVAVAAHGRHVRWPGWVRVALLMVLSASTIAFGHRHNQSWDLSAGQVNTLQPETRRVLAALGEPVMLTIVRPQEEVFDSVYGELSRLLDRMQEFQPQLQVSELDPLAHPDRVARWSFELAIRPEDFASGGAVVLQRGQRTRSIDLLAMATFSADELGVGSLATLRAESALRDAIAELSELRAETLCSTTGHGELPSARTTQASEHWATVAERVASDGILLREVRSLADSPLASCDAILLMGPAQALASEELIALQNYRLSGGNVLIALRSHPLAGATRPPKSGLGLVLEQAGVRALPAVVVDPLAEVDLPRTWMTYEGYGDHVIVEDFLDRRATIWQTPLALQRLDDASEILVQASEAGFAEHSLQALFETSEYQKSTEDTDDRIVALARLDDFGARLVVLASAEAFSSLWSERGIGGNERLLLSSLHWVLERESHGGADAGVHQERIRLLMSSAELKRAFLWCVVVGPVFFALLGILLWWWRRREA
tara:strand:+ start:82261 stop:84420 length:2160 start_codon:yes stop_codon:yes gene_type:complete